LETDKYNESKSEIWHVLNENYTKTLNKNMMFKC